MTVRIHETGALVVGTEQTQIVLDTTGGVPVPLHVGRPLPHAVIGELRLAPPRPLAKATLDVEAPASICPEQGSGWQGRPGLLGRRADGSAWAPRFVRPSVSVDDAGRRARVVAVDDVAGLELTSELLDLGASVRVRLALRNIGADSYELDELLVTMPVPARATELVHLTGRWSHEFRPTRRPFSEGAHGFDNRRGRTSHDRVPALWATVDGAAENRGEAWACVLGWSGNAVSHAEALADGRRVVQMGAALAPGEVRLGEGDVHTTPWVEIAYSDRGLNGTSQAFHRSIRARPVAATGPRPVIFNSWEAVYFDHGLDTLTSLVDAAAEVGVERFVLDDGWFHGRRRDDAGLGDWWVDPAVWPDGLDPLIRHVHERGMEFGIWVEPEMVNPDSDLYRQHPEWVLAARGYEPVLGRNQLVLDLGNPAVRAHLLEALDALLRDHEIAYVKWDMNRDLVHAAAGDRAGQHANVLGVYELIDELRRRHPGVEIESCASGGARADFEILHRTERIWTSDTNDALERQRIQRGFSMLFPPEVMGAHIGPPRSHTSGRHHALGFRAATAFFGHLGIEWNVLRASAEERSELARLVALHKEHRALLHTGEIWRQDTSDPAAVSHLVVAADGAEAILSYAQLELPGPGIPPLQPIVGLDDDRTYRLSIVPLGPVDGPVDAQTPWLGDAHYEASGAFLREIGFQPPLLHPESAVVIHLRAV